MNDILVGIFVGAAATVVAAPIVSALAAFRPKQRIVWAERTTKVVHEGKNSPKATSIHNELFLQNLSWFGSGDVELEFKGEIDSLKISRHRLSILGRTKFFSRVDAPYTLVSDRDGHKVTLKAVEGRTQFEILFGALDSYSCASLKSVTSNGRLYEIGGRDFGIVNSNFRIFIETLTWFALGPLFGFSLAALAQIARKYFG